MNTVLAVLGVIVAAVIVIALSIWLGKSRKRDLDRAMGKVAPDNKKTRDAKAAEAEEAKAATAAEPAKSAESAKAEPAPAAQAEPEPAAAPKPESQPASKPTPAKPETPESVGSRLTRLKAKLAKSGNPFGKAHLGGSPLSAQVLGDDQLGLNREVYDVNLTASYEFAPGLTFTTVNGYRRFDSREVFDADGSAAWFLEFAEIAKGWQASHEGRF